MSVYTIETRANPGQLTRHIEGDVIPIDAYTESFPANAPIRSFKNRAVPRGLGRMPGFVISGLLGFEVDKLWFSYFSEDPDVALTILQAANNHAKSRMMTVASYFERDRKIGLNTNPCCNN